MDRFSELGADVRCQPAIQIGPPATWHDVDAAIDRLADFDWIVFSSANGVRFFLARLRERGRDHRALGHARLAVIGPGTRDELARNGLLADLIPDTFVAEALADALKPQTMDKRVLLIRASRGRDILAESLHSTAHEVCQVVTYESTDAKDFDADIRGQLADGQIDWVTVTSSAIATSLANSLGPLLKKTRLVSISPITTATLHELGFEPAAEADEQTMAGVVAAVLANTESGS